MSARDFEPWEPEESVGKLWHSYVTRLDAPQHFEMAAATLDDARGRLAILFRGLGGARDVEIKEAPSEDSTHRLSWRRRLGQTAERLSFASFDGEVLRLPPRVALFADHDANLALYVWLAASSAFAVIPDVDTDPLQRDLRALQAAQATTRATLTACPGLRRMHAELVRRTRALRGDRGLPATEAALEATIRHLLGGPLPTDHLAVRMSAAVRGTEEDVSGFSAPSGYQPMMPVPLWPLVSPPPARAKSARDDDAAQGNTALQADESRAIKGQRKDADQAARKDSLILHKFESILSWAEFLNVNRRIDDDDTDNAKKAADDQNNVSLARVPQKAKARLRLHLDLSPEESDFERLAGKHTYPEWDHRAKTYLPDYCRILEGAAPAAAELPPALTSRAAQRRMRQVRRQFEALRPKRIPLTRQIDGEDIDIDAAIHARIELAATGEHDDRVYRATRSEARDLAVSILLDASRSTESIVAGRQVLDIAREALLALAHGLTACGDETAISAFSSLRRDRVFMHICKSFDEPMSDSVTARIAGLTPGHYTRLGTAIRHASRDLAKRPRQRRLLLVLTDGKPNDLDHYEGRHGVEDTHMAVREARRLGQSVFGITIDSKARATFHRIFSAHGFVVVPDPDKLISALPAIYRQLVSS